LEAGAPRETFGRLPAVHRRHVRRTRSATSRRRRDTARAKRR
jgi:hypothetical protein